MAKLHEKSGEENSMLKKIVNLTSSLLGLIGTIEVLKASLRRSVEQLQVSIGNEDFFDEEFLNEYRVQTLNELRSNLEIARVVFDSFDKSVQDLLKKVE